MKRELPRQLVALMICRAVLLTALLSSGLVIGRLLKQPLLGSHHFYLLIGAGYALTIAYALLHPLISRHAAGASVQVAGDIVLITGFVYVTGGLESPFSLLYFLPIIAAGILLGRAGALSSATGAWVMYAFLVVLIVSGWVPQAPGAAEARTLETQGGVPADAAAEKRAAYALFSHFLGFVTVAQLSSYLALKLEAAGDQLEEQRDALANLEALNKNIIDSITSGIITTDLEGGITFINRGAEEITQQRLAAARGERVDVFLGREEGFLAGVVANLERDRRYRFESAIRRGDGATLYLGFSSAVLRDQRGEPRGYIFSFQDLTEIKALEEEVQLKDRMAALGEMAAGIAHEIRNPLASMFGSVQILKKSLQPPGEDGELLDIVLRESRRLDGIIHDFLLFARPGRFSAGPADLVPLLADSLRLLRNSDEFGDGHGVETLFDREGVVALVDPNMIRQVFWNLAKNALKAMPDGGVLTVRAKRDGAGSVEVCFADTGVGMDEEEVRRAFEPFHGRFREGTGLGLSVVFRIVHEHGGRIRVKSRPGRGTEVILTLPAPPEGRIRAGAAVSGSVT